MPGGAADPRASNMRQRKRLISESEILKTYERTGTILRGHFAYPSGNHGDVYVNKDGLSPHTETISALCRAIAYWFVDDQVQVVAAPALAGIVLSQRVAEHLCWMTGWRYHRDVFSVYAERLSNAWVFRRGYEDLIPGQRVLVVEDIFRTGRTARAVVEAVRNLGGEVVGVAALCNLRGVTASDVGDVPEFFALASLDLTWWIPSECPLCAQGVEIDVEIAGGKQTVLDFADAD